MFQENKAIQIFQKTNISYPLIRTRVCKKCLFFGKFSVLCFLETPFLRFALLPYYRRIETSRNVWTVMCRMHKYNNLFVTLKNSSKYKDCMHSAVTDYVLLRIFGKPLWYQMNYRELWTYQHFAFIILRVCHKNSFLVGGKIIPYN